MNRWSFIKRFGPVNFDDFMFFARQFCDAVRSHYDSPSRVTVTFYAKLPHTITTVQPGINEWLDEKNKEGELAKVIGFENVTRELFEQAVNVQLDIRPEDDDKAPKYTVGYLECKGLLNRHLVYYVQPKEVGGLVERLLLGEQRPSKVSFSIGDGYEHCHLVTVS